MSRLVVIVAAALALVAAPAVAGADDTPVTVTVRAPVAGGSAPRAAPTVATDRPISTVVEFSGEPASVTRAASPRTAATPLLFGALLGAAALIGVFAPVRRRRAVRT